MASSLNLGMHRDAQQERFGDAFLLAVASVAGCACAKPETDNDSIDWTLSCRLPHRPKIDVQVKTVSLDGEIPDMIAYPLKRKNYDDLIVADLLSPRILVLVAVPSDIDSWLSVSREELILRRSAYWLSLTGLPESDNKAKVTVYVPSRQIFTVKGLCEMMQKINEEGAL
jgi:hypothetical protein